MSSLASLTKLNGILCVFILLFIFLVKNRFSISRDGWKSLITGFIAFLIITVLLNPVFLNTGVKAVWKMVDVRWAVFRLYQEAWKSVALLSISERFYVAAQMIFFKYSIFYQLMKVPVELILFGGRSLLCLQKERTASNPYIRVSGSDSHLSASLQHAQVLLLDLSLYLYDRGPCPKPLQRDALQ